MKHINNPIVLELAKSFNGPWDFKDRFNTSNNPRFPLKEIRDIRWNQLHDMEKSETLCGIVSIIRHLNKNPHLIKPFIEEIKNYHD